VRYMAMLLLTFNSLAVETGRNLRGVMPTVQFRLIRLERRRDLSGRRQGKTPN
jgi:hypothetical protein